MSNTIPPLLSNSPPPIIETAEDYENDDFGDFNSAIEDLPYEDDELSLSCNIQQFSNLIIDPNSNNNNQNVSKIDDNLTYVRKESLNKCETSKVELTSSEIIENKLDEKKFDLNKIENFNCDTRLFSQYETENNYSSLDQNLKFGKHKGERTVENEVEITNEEIDDDFGNFDNYLKNEDENFKDYLPNEIKTEVKIICEKSDQNFEDLENSTIENNLGNYNVNDSVNFQNSFEEIGISKDFSENGIKTEPENITTDIDESKNSITDEASTNFKDSSISFNKNENNSLVNSDKIESSSCSLPKKSETQAAENNEEFSDLNDFEQSNVSSYYVPNPDGTENEEFDDFADFSSASNFSNPIETDENLSPIELPKITEVDEIIKENFPFQQENTEEEYHSNTDENENEILKKVREITETTAVSYKWDKSNSQNSLFKALNIDMRNILYGPRWNDSVPPFAANLGFTPLEPLKPDSILLPTNVQDIPLNVPNEKLEKDSLEDIPSVQFDWNLAGLTNPLDLKSNKSLKDLKSNEGGLSIEDNFISKLTEETSVKSLNLNENSLEFDSFGQNNKSVVKMEDEEFGDFEDFSSFEKPKEIPLRETHISNDVSNTLPETKDDFSSFMSITVAENTIINSQVTTEVIEDDFDDFQTSSMPVKETSKNVEIRNEVSATKSTTTSFNPTASILVPSQVTSNYSCLEPLQPIPVNSSISIQPKIEWPEPGITSQDLENIELSYKSKVFVEKNEKIANEIVPTTLSKENKGFKQNTNTSTPLNLDIPAIISSNLTGDIESSSIKSSSSKQSTNHKNSITLTENNTKHSNINVTTLNGSKGGDEEDDWSDFVSSGQVSTQNSSMSSNISGKSRGVLQLSISQLNQLQPPRKPTPLITHQGLYMSGTNQNQFPSISISSPTKQARTQTYNNTNNTQRSPSGYSDFQPSLISNQYAKQVETLAFGYQKKTKTECLEDDDEWSDFVSSRPAGNGLRQPKPNWPTTNATPNIITNPVSFDSLRSYGGQQQQQGRNKSGTATFVPSTNVPELDFVVPKSRTWKK